MSITVQPSLLWQIYIHLSWYNNAIHLLPNTFNIYNFCHLNVWTKVLGIISLLKGQAQSSNITNKNEALAQKYLGEQDS